jgi:hypothetical protein
MSSSPGAGYKLRPNKSVDRELFMSLLTRLAAPLKLENYKYIGLGGPFLEDFRMVHGRIGIKDMVCIDSDEKTHLRQLFNRPIESVKCIHSTLEDYLDSTEFENPIILWLDFTDPKKVQSQIEMFIRQVAELPIKSILRITLNANPSSLGKPDPEEVSVNLTTDTSDIFKPTEKEWRLERFKERLTDYCPTDLNSENMSQKKYGVTLLSTLSLAAEKSALSIPNRKLIWCLNTQYSDGQFMVTATAIITNEDDGEINDVIDNWEYHSSPEKPHILDMPALSMLERLTMEAHENPKEILGYDLPDTYMKKDPFETFKQFYRVFPHFSRVEV